MLEKKKKKARANIAKNQMGFKQKTNTHRVQRPMIQEDIHLKSPVTVATLPELFMLEIL